MNISRAAKKKPEEINRTPLKEIAMSSEDWDEFAHGVSLFNSRKFWHSHEAWEQVWKRHNEDERLFFQGLIQLAAAYHQLVSKKSFRGMLNNFDKAYHKLKVFEPEYLGVLVSPLFKFIGEGKEEAVRLGPERLEQFHYSLIPKLQFHKPYNPDVFVEVRDIVRSQEFLEGLTLFNSGYPWEAHEVWENVSHNEEGEAKEFIQAFVRLASANSLLKLNKVESARYLYEKVLETMRQYETLHCGIDLGCLASDIETCLALLPLTSNNSHANNIGVKITLSSNGVAVRS